MCGRGVSGRVVDEDDGKGIATDVTFTTKETGRPAARVMSGEGGEFTVLLAPGEAEAMVRDWEKDGWKPEMEKVAVQDGMGEVVLKRHRQPVLRGTLTDEHGKPVKGWVYIDNDWVESDVNWAYAMLQPQGMNMGVAMDDAKLLGAGFVYKYEEEGKRLDLVLEPLGSIVGRIVDERGRGVADAAVELWVHLGKESSESAAWWVWKATVEGDGRFEIAPVPVGYSLTVRATRGAENMEDKEVATMTGGEEVDVGKVRLRRISISGVGTIAGRIVGEDGKPLSGVVVSAEGGVADAITDLAGRFTLEHVPADRKVNVGARCEGYGYWSWTVQPGEAGREFQMLRPGHGLFGKPAPGLMVDEWVQGKVEGWAGLKGKVVLLEVGDPDVVMTKRLLDRYGPKGLMVVTVREHAAAEREPGVEAWCKENGVTWAVGVDADVEKTPAWVKERQGSGATASVYDSREFTSSMYLMDTGGVVRGAPAGSEVEGEIGKLLRE